MNIYLAIMGKTFEINGPTGEEPNEDVKSSERAKNNGGIDEIETGKNNRNPHAVDDSERPNVEAPRQLLLPKQIDSVHHLATHVKTRHRRWRLKTKRFC